MYKMYQNWFIRCFVQPVFEEFVKMAFTMGQIKLSGGQPITGNVEDIQKAAYQPRRWSWVDPQKDMNTNKMFIDERLKSRSQIMREQGDNPEEVWGEIAKEQDFMLQLGIEPIKVGESDSEEKHSQEQV
jgi:capsid protein